MGSGGVNKQSKVASKLCIKCNRVLPLGKFYPNKSWQSQRYHDAWCKDCANRYCVDKKTQQQYCYENNRTWRDSFWDSALKKAQYTLSGNADYIDPKATQEKRDKLLDATAARSFFGFMNLRQFYVFVENVRKDGTFAEEMDDNDGDEMLDEKPHFSKEWGGYYTDQQIEIMNDKYERYEDDFVLDNVSIQDYARKVVKASLNADIAEQKYRRGDIGLTEYRDALRVFDDLSKSSNFAACRRKPGEAAGLGSLGEIILRIEVDGQLNENGFTFPEDDIDKIIHDFDHTLAAVGLENGWMKNGDESIGA